MRMSMVGMMDYLDVRALRKSPAGLMCAGNLMRLKKAPEPCSRMLALIGVLYGVERKAKEPELKEEQIAHLHQSAKACGLNEHNYLTDILRQYRSHPVMRLSELLPANWKPL